MVNFYLCSHVRFVHQLAAQSNLLGLNLYNNRVFNTAASIQQMQLKLQQFDNVKKVCKRLKRLTQTIIKDAKEGKDSKTRTNIQTVKRTNSASDQKHVISRAFERRCF